MPLLSSVYRVYGGRRGHFTLEALVQDVRGDIPHGGTIHPPIPAAHAMVSFNNLTLLLTTGQWNTVQSKT